MAQEMSERHCGRLGKHTTATCASRAAAAILTFESARAVCVGPDGMVTVEYPGTAPDDELVGIYTRDGDDLAERIEEDLEDAVKRRRIRGGTHHRHRVKPTRRLG